MGVLIMIYSGVSIHNGLKDVYNAAQRLNDTVSLAVFILFRAGSFRGMMKYV